MKIEIKNKLPETTWPCLRCGETHIGNDGCPTCPPVEDEDYFIGVDVSDGWKTTVRATLDHDTWTLNIIEIEREYVGDDPQETTDPNLDPIPLKDVVAIENERVDLMIDFFTQESELLKSIPMKRTDG